MLEAGLVLRVSTLCVGCSTGGAVCAGRPILLDVDRTPPVKARNSNITPAPTQAQAATSIVRSTRTTPG